MDAEHPAAFCLSTLLACAGRFPLLPSQSLLSPFQVTSSMCCGTSEAHPFLPRVGVGVAVAGPLSEQSAAAPSLPPAPRCSCSPAVTLRVPARNYFLEVYFHLGA